MLNEMSLHHEERKNSYFVIYGEDIPCPASPERRRPSAASFRPRTHSDGPVSQTLLTSDFKRRELLRAFATLDDSTPQCRISELRMNPLLCSRHHRQVTLAVKTVWPAKSSQQSVLPLISLVVFLLYVSGDVVTS